MRASQKGFVLIEGFLICAIIALIAGTGYYVWHSNQQTDKTLTSTQNENITPASSKKSSSPSSTQKYLTIKEWGVRLSLPSETSSLYYVINSDDTNSAFLGFHNVDKIAPNCAADKISEGVIFRQTPQQRQSALDSSSDVSPPADTKISDYYYGYSHPQAACDDGTTTTENAINKAEPNQNIKAIFATIEAIPQ